MDPWIWNQVGLELIKIHIESSLKSERSSDRGEDLCYQAVEVGVGGCTYTQIALA